MRAENKNNYLLVDNISKLFIFQFGFEIIVCVNLY